jgi:hypothetical protein
MNGRARGRLRVTYTSVLLGPACPIRSVAHRPHNRSTPPHHPLHCSSSYTYPPLMVTNFFVSSPSGVVVQKGNCLSLKQATRWEISRRCAHSHTLVLSVRVWLWMIAGGSAACPRALHARVLARTHTHPHTSTHGTVPPRPCVLHRDHDLRDRSVFVMISSIIDWTHCLFQHAGQPSWRVAGSVPRGRLLRYIPVPLERALLVVEL